MKLDDGSGQIACNPIPGVVNPLADDGPFPNSDRCRGEREVPRPQFADQRLRGVGKIDRNEGQGRNDQDEAKDDDDGGRDDGPVSDQPRKCLEYREKGDRKDGRPDDDQRKGSNQNDGPIGKKPDDAQSDKIAYSRLYRNLP
ncbi:hypothetical protein FHX10_000975 [Rhizobium sp. BK591]|nr:hypothetical protein [Rhizobium sp. BK591]